MKTYSDTAASYQFLPIAASIIVIVIGCLVVIGWLFNLTFLQQILPESPKMTANTAVAFIMAGFSLRQYNMSSSSAGVRQGQRWLALILAISVTLLALLTLSEYLFNWDLGLDQLLFEDRTAVVETDIPGRPSPHTALTFTFVGLSLLLLHTNIPRRHWLTQFLTLSAAFIALLALVGYGFSISSFFRISAYTGMALHTAVSLLIICVGLLFLHPDRGFMALITTANLGGVMARRLLIAATGVPLVVGWVSMLGEQAGLYSPQFEPVLLAVLSAYIYSGVIWWYAHSLNKMDADRNQAEEQFRLVVEASPNAITLVNTVGKISLVNQRTEVLFGYGREELLDQPIEMLVPSQFRTHHNSYRDEFINAPTARPMGAGRELFGLRKDGSQVPVEIGLNPITTTKGSFVLASIIDITERKRAEAQFRLAMEASPNAIIMTDTTGNISLVNTQTKRMFGYTREELLGQPIEMLVPPQFRAHHQDYRDGFFKAPSSRPMGAGRDLFGLHKDGSQMPVEIGLNPITTIEGSFVLASIIDITERKQAEAEIAESLRREQVARVEAEAAQQRLAFLVEASHTLASSLDYYAILAIVAQLAVPHIADWCAVDVLEPSGSLRRVAVVHTNPAKVELAYELQRRFPPDPEAPRGTYHVLRTGQAEFIPEISDSFLEAAGLNEEQLNIIRELGLKSAITVPMLARNQAFGTITFVVAESGRYYNDVDLTLAMELASRVALAVENARLYQEAKKANEELEQRVIKRTAQLEAANKELEAFSYSVSHDLRAPLRGIDGFSQALLEDYADSLDGQAQHYLQRVRAASQRMAQLIDDLLMLSRLSRSEMRLESVDLSALAQSITAELHQLEPEREVKFLIAHDVTVQADKQLIRVVLENLLRNAWKFTAKHKVAHIEFGVSSQPNGQLAYFVRDDGAGFDMAYADKLFDAFQRLHTPAEFSGTGIGLATVQRIIHRHDGRVWGEGAVEKGASIYFTLSPFMAGEAGNRM
jgi:PAS domain S-box-containing protein